MSEDSQIRHLTENSELYPPLLREIDQPPKELFVRGNIQLLSAERLVGVVGSRRASAYGKRCVNAIFGDVAAAGIPLVSGLAYGIDTMAHRVCLEHTTPTIAVLGSGIDQTAIYPRANAGLAQRIIDAGGAVVSEYPPGTPAYQGHFPARNRIIAGLCQGVVIVQAAERSGSLITARLALESGREVGAVPGPITEGLSAGTNLLIRQGAAPILEAQDVLDWYGLTLPEAPAPTVTLTATEQQIIERLSDIPYHIDEIVAATGLASPVVSLTLTELELKDAVEHVGGQKYISKIDHRS